MILLLLLSFNVFAQTEVKYRYNYDGDTITFDIGKVRVLGVDAPEIKSNKPCEKDFAKISKAYVEKLMKGAKRITLTNHRKRDIYGRILADVNIDGVDLKESLLKQNLAVPYVPKKFQKVNWCKIQEKGHEPKKF